MKIYELSVEQMARTGFTHQHIITFADLTAAASTQTINLRTDLAAGKRVEHVSYNLKTPFTGGSTSDLTVQVGYTAGSTVTDGLLQALSIHASGADVLAGGGTIADTDASTVDSTYGSQESTVISSLRTIVNSLIRRAGVMFGAAGNMTALFTASGANLNTLTAGEVHIFYRLSDTTLFK